MAFSPGSVVLLKAAKEETGRDPYLQILDEAGYSAVCIQVLSFNFINQVSLAEALSSPSQYSGLILTSPRAAESLNRLVEGTDSPLFNSWEGTLQKVWNEKPTFVVGSATAAAVYPLGLTTRGEDTGNAEHLAPIISQEVPPGEEPLLFPCSSLKRDALTQSLRQAGINVKCITAYETGASPDIQPDLQRHFEKVQPEYGVFFSPSGVRSTLPALTALNWDINILKCIAIGPTTEAELRKNGLTVHGVATSPNPTATLTAIQGDPSAV